MKDVPIHTVVLDRNNWGQPRLRLMRLTPDIHWHGRLQTWFIAVPEITW